MTEQVVQLNPDEKAVCMKTLSDLFFAAKQLHEWLGKDSLSVEMAGTLPSLIESHFTSIAKLLNYESTLTKDHEERFVEVRKANGRVRELEKQLAESRPIDGLTEQLDMLRDTVYDWWKEEGFRHVSEIQFTGHGSMHVEFSFMLDASASALLCDTPVTDVKKKINKIQKLIEAGFELERENENSRSWDVLDTQRNRQLLADMLEERFPSIDIAKIESWAKQRGESKGKFTIWRFRSLYPRFEGHSESGGTIPCLNRRIGGSGLFSFIQRNFQT